MALVAVTLAVQWLEVARVMNLLSGRQLLVI